MENSKEESSGSAAVRQEDTQNLKMRYYVKKFEKKTKEVLIELIKYVKKNIISENKKFALVI